MSQATDTVREATKGTEYEGRLYVVGGVPRDRFLGLPASDDVDIVVDGDAFALARFLAERGLSEHAPVEYPRFGTAKISVGGHPVELVSARAESYDSGSRKPTVRRATLLDDVLRRDFTINTLVENVHTGEVLDLTGRAFADLRDGILRTPLEPRVTFYDDPLRMLRAVRFAVRFGFIIEPETWESIREEAHRINLMGPDPPVVSAERIRDEFLKIVQSPDPARGLELLRESGLLAQFLPELLDMVGVTQNAWHLYDVWEHTVRAMRCLPPDASLEMRLGLLFHDVGKPATRTEDDKGVHFYEHQFVGAEMTRRALHRLRLTNDQIRDVAQIVALHMRLGEARPEWADAAIRRLIRDTADYVDVLFDLGHCDMSAMNPEAPVTDLDALRARMDEINRISNAAKITSPLDGCEIIETLGIAPGPLVGKAKEYLTNEVIEGRLAEGDKEAAREMLRASWPQLSARYRPDSQRRRMKDE